MIFPQVYEANEHTFKSPFLIVTGRMSRREGTHNIVVESVRPFSARKRRRGQGTGDRDPSRL